MRTFELIDSVKNEDLLTKSFVRFVSGRVLVVMDKDYGDEIKIRGEKSDAILSKIDIKSNIILNGNRRVTVSCDPITNNCAEAVLVFPIQNDVTYFSNATVYGIYGQMLSDVIGDYGICRLESGVSKLTEIPYKQHTIDTNDEVSNFVIANKRKCKVPLLNKIQIYCGIPCKFVMITDKDYGENIIVSKDDNKVSLTRMRTISCTIVNNTKKLTVLYDNATRAESFYIPADYSKPTAYITSLERFISAIGERHFYLLGYDLCGFSLYDPKYAKTYSMNFEAINKTYQDSINISYKAETLVDKIFSNILIVHGIKTIKTTFDNIDILKDNMKSFIKEIKDKYNITYDEWNCKVYIKSYSYYDGEYTIEDVFDLNNIE